MLPNKKTILIDGGEEKQEIILKYLLARRITTIDYMFISHVDSDHLNGCIEVLKKLKVHNVIIGKQFEISEEYKNFINMVKEKKVQIYSVETNNRVTIENNLYIDILWPDSKHIINANTINNNSLVCKLVYKNFSMLFTGDIEEIAEKAILEKYNNNLKALNANILKVAHHGSKTSSTNKLLEIINPQIALIGVGKNNSFGHPSNITLENLQSMKCEIYRTDEDGEITIKTDGKKLKIEKFIK